MAGKLDAAKELGVKGLEALNTGLRAVGKPPKGMERVPGKPGNFRPKRTSPGGGVLRKGETSDSKGVAVRSPSQVARTATKKEARKARNSGLKRLGLGAAGAGSLSLFGDGDEKRTAPGAGVRDDKKADKKADKKYNVGVSKGGVPFKEAFKYNRGEGKKTFTWNGKKYTTELASEKSKKDAKKPAAKKKVGGIRRALFGRDGKMGGPGKGLFDNKVTRAFTKRDELNDLRAEVAKKKPKEVKNGGMMRSKGMSKGGAMKKKGYAMGGAAMKKKGYSKGGVVKAVKKIQSRLGANFDDAKTKTGATSKGRIQSKDGKTTTHLMGPAVIKVQNRREQLKGGGKAAAAAAALYGIDKLPKGTKEELNAKSGSGSKSSTRAAFEKAFSKARNDGKSVFTFRGKKYNTDISTKTAGKVSRVVKKNMGGMMKKKGYSSGGAVRKATKPRGVGAATRGYGKAMR